MDSPEYKEQIYVLKIDVGVPESTYQQLLNNVDSDKKSRIQKFHRREDAFRCLFADLLIRFLLIKNYGLKNGDIHFLYSDYGKPSITDFPDFHFNLSHSGNCVVCAVSSRPVGVDVEVVAPIDLEIADAYFSTKEKHTLFSLPPAQQRDFFFQLWTLKESYIKMMGKGLSMPLNSFSVLTNDSGRLVLEHGELTDNQTFFALYYIDDQYNLALCSRNPTKAGLIVVDLKDIVSLFEN